jgi:hypothetical protein
MIPLPIRGAALIIPIAALLLSAPRSADAQETLIQRAGRTADLLEGMESGAVPMDDEAFAAELDALETLLAELDAHLVDHPDDLERLLLAVRLGRFSFDIQDLVEPAGADSRFHRDLARIDQVLGHQPQNAHAHYLRASLLAGVGLRGVLGVFDSAADAGAREARSYQALEPARRAVELDPGVHHYRFLLRTLLHLHGMFDEARSAGAPLPDADEWERVAEPFAAFIIPPGGAYWPAGTAAFLGVLAVVDAMGWGNEPPPHLEARVRAYVYPVDLDALAASVRAAIGDDSAFRDAPDPEMGGAILQESFFWSEGELVRGPRPEGTPAAPLTVALLAQTVLGDDVDPFDDASLHSEQFLLPRLSPALRDRLGLGEGDDYAVLVTVSGWWPI